MQEHWEEKSFWVLAQSCLVPVGAGRVGKTQGLKYPVVYIRFSSLRGKLESRFFSTKNGRERDKFVW